MEKKVQEEAARLRLELLGRLNEALAALVKNDREHGRLVTAASFPGESVLEGFAAVAQVIDHIAGPASHPLEGITSGVGNYQAIDPQTAS